ncbi:hypothetical protein LX95_00268 [Mesonia algae]|uniref:Uncharacterized protein n=1 Tax=Mesonia algae TaxID=213248 RepID=A0A2W7IC19_9FLAO|nr:hypothetical protein [Mesonia algae]PZW43939.1 hypothetical protein LX95_00268 [Mesonia algae]
MLLDYDYQYVDGGYYFALGNIDNKFFHIILISVPTDDLEIEQGNVYPFAENTDKLYITYLDEE